MKKNVSDIGWNFSNSYTSFSETMYTRISPVPVKDPSIVIFNKVLSKELGLDFTNLSTSSVAQLFCGNVLPEGSEPLAQAYAGHQFGHFTNLGDGRAIVIGEHISPKKNKFDIQFKGSGPTPYSRGADGRAVLGPMLREYIISEAMHALGIATTRSLAVVKTGEYVFRESPLPGAVLTRVAASHIRVGTFQYLASKGDVSNLRKLVEYSISRHYPHIEKEENLAIALLNEVIKKQIDLIISWMRVGFIHVVMNTDNMTISGETIDYGPCAFMDQYDNTTCFSSIDLQGRYSYGNQPIAAHWNLARFAETLLPLIHQDENEAIKIAEQIINSFKSKYEIAWLKMMRAKIGFFGKEGMDSMLIHKLLQWMHSSKADYTNTFCYLMGHRLGNIKSYQETTFIDWHKEWQDRIKRSKKSESEVLSMMQSVNPVIIPRNHLIEESLQDAEKGDLSRFKKMLKFLKYPYSYQEGLVSFQIPSDREYKTFCGT